MEEEQVKVMVSSVNPDSSRRNSMGKINTKTSPSLLSSDEKPRVPHYMRASTNSCHEFCKHGLKHVFEPKKRLPRRIVQISMAPKQKRVEVPIPKQMKKRVQPEMNLDKSEDKELMNIKDIEVSESVNLEAASDTQGDNSASTAFEEHSKEPVTINVVEESVEASDDVNTGSSSPIEKRVTSVELMTPPLSSEGSAGGDSIENIELELPLHICASTSEVEESFVDKSREPEPDKSSIELMTPPFSSEGSAGFSIDNVELELLMDIQTSTNEVEESSVGKSLQSEPDKSSIRKSLVGRTKGKGEATSNLKQKSSAPNRKSDSAAEEQNQMRNVRMPESKKAVDKVKDDPQLKSETRIESLTKKKTPSTVEKKSIVTNNSQWRSPSTVATKVTKQISKPTSPSVKSMPPARAPSERPTALRNITGNKLSRSISLTKREVVVLKPSRVSKPTAGNETSKLRNYRSLKPPSPVKKSAEVVGNSEKLRNYRSLKPPSPVKKSDEKMKAKILCDAAMKTANRTPNPMKKGLKKNKAYSSSETTSSPYPSSSASKLSEASKFVTGKEEGTKREPVIAPKKLQRRTSLEGKLVPSPRKIQKGIPTAKTEEKIPSPHKLKFRRGTVVNPESESSTPRKLKFKQPKISTDRNTKEVVKRIVRRRRLSCGSTAELNSGHLKPPAVVLRHQDVQEKEAKGLFNEVIEETASKLVEVRKSKVKALVGAFETVISLQETRVSPV